MIIKNMEPGRLNVLGRVGENSHRQMAFDVGMYSTMYPGAEYTLLNRPCGASEAYPVPTIEHDGGRLIWTVTSSDTAVEGEGQCQLVIVQDGVVAKTIIYDTVVYEALDAGGPAPDPYAAWQLELTRLRTEIEAHLADIDALRAWLESLGLSVVNGELNYTWNEEATER